MRRLFVITILATLALSGCGREQDFDKQYAETEKQLQAEAKRLDSELAKAKAAEPGEKLPAQKPRH